MAHGSSAGPGGRGSAAAGLPAAGRQAKWRAPSWAGCLGREAPERGRGNAAPGRAARARAPAGDRAAPLQPVGPGPGRRYGVAVG